MTTLLHHFDLAGQLDFLVDDNPVKQNTFSPGHHLPVYESQKLYDKKRPISRWCWPGTTFNQSPGGIRSTWRAAAASSCRCRTCR